MTAFRITLFDEEDRKQLEGMLTSALVRAIRTLVKEGTLQLGGAAPATRPAVAAPAADAPAVRPAPAPTSTWPAPSPPEPAPSTAREQAPVVPPHLAAQAPKKERSDLRKIIKTVEHRPHGWIDRSEALQLISKGPDDKSADSSLSYWIKHRQVGAVIVATAKPPNKGLPGRVHVDKEGLLRRNQQRVEAVATNPRYTWRVSRKQA